MHICFPIKIKSAADNDNEIASGAITVNNFFSHRIKEIDIKRYVDDIPRVPLTNNVNIYRYSHEILKHMPEDMLKTFEKNVTV